MEIGLCGELREEEDTKNFISHAGFVGGEAASKDVAETKGAFG